MTRKELTDAFNSLSVEERKQFLQTLSQTEYKKFIKDLGDQAVQDYWDNERELIKQGKGTRDWTVEQQNTILNIGKNGQELKHAQAPKDINGKTYEGQHMVLMETTLSTAVPATILFVVATVRIHIFLQRVMKLTRLTNGEVTIVLFSLQTSILMK